jgi:hypothetical protein
VEILEANQWDYSTSKLRNMEINIDSFNRLSLGIMEKESCRPDEALSKLESLSLNLVCNIVVESSVPMQAALLTAVNTGKRAFLGGVYVQMPKNVKALISWPSDKSLNEIIVDLGGILIDNVDENNFSLTFGFPASIDENRAQVVCNNWQAGILSNNETCNFEFNGTIPTAGIFAGSFGVVSAFLKMSGIKIAAADQSAGISLWRPDLDWLDGKASGPAISILPKRFWMMGLGHLGQAYLWNIGLLPYSNPHEAIVLLQDYDKLVAGNWSAGLLSEVSDSGKYKTRICSEWLEKRGFQTIISERPFDESTKRCGEEPFLALCGFDSSSSRMSLENAGFDLIIESGIGGKLGTFDIVALHTFPESSRSPFDIWGQQENENNELNETIYELIKDMTDEICGILPLTIAGKAVSASFVGACTGALVIAEALRGLNGGIRYEKINIQLRDITSSSAVKHHKGTYLQELARNGFVSAIC